MLCATGRTAAAYMSTTTTSATTRSVPPTPVRPSAFPPLTALQVVNLEFASGATVSFTMVAQTSLICERQSRLHFSHGEIVGDMDTFTVTDFRTGKSTHHAPAHEGGHHGGGDLGLIRTFIEAVRTGRQELLGTDVSEVLKSHMTVFAAEQSRRDGTVVDCEKFEREAKARVLGESP